MTSSRGVTYQRGVKQLLFQAAMDYLFFDTCEQKRMVSRVRGKVNCSYVAMEVFEWPRMSWKASMGMGCQSGNRRYWSWWTHPARELDERRKMVSSGTMVTLEGALMCAEEREWRVFGCVLRVCQVAWACGVWGERL